MRAAAWTIVFALCACTLPKGKLVPPDEPQRSSTQRRAMDAGIDANTVDAALQTERDAATSDAASGSSEGNMSRKMMAVPMAAVPASNQREPKPNGELCRGNEDCATGNCKSGDNGERRCFGKLKLDESCSQPYDCDGYSCVPLTFAGKTSVCLDEGACRISGSCFADYGIAMCQLDQLCNDRPGSFNQCFQRACTLAGSSNAQCLSALPTRQSLNESACCPSGGVFNGNCSAAPQCGCPEDKKCSIDGTTGKATCMPVGTVPPGASCAKPEDCTKGYGCAGLVCKQHCEGLDDTSCIGGGTCREIAFMTEPTGAHCCTRPCDPFDPTSTAPPFLGCGEDQRCNPAADGKSDCLKSGTIPVGSTCDDGQGKASFNTCEPTALCVTPQLVCTPLCRVGVNDCESGDCRSFGATPLFVDQTEVGYCAPP